METDYYGVDKAKEGSVFSHKETYFIKYKNIVWFTASDPFGGGEVIAYPAEKAWRDSKIPFLLVESLSVIPETFKIVNYRDIEARMELFKRNRIQINDKCYAELYKDSIDVYNDVGALLIRFNPDKLAEIREAVNEVTKC